MSNVTVISEVTLNKIEGAVCQYYECQGIDFNNLDVGTQDALCELWNIRNPTVSDETL